MTSYPKTTKSKPPRSVLRRTLVRRYGQIALPWAKLGFAVIPAALDGKNPAVKFSPWTTGKQTKPSRRIDFQQVVEWSDDHLGCNRGLLLLDSNPELRLVAVDVDDPRWWPWVIATFGDTPYKVYSGRDVPEGSDRPGHAYYLAPKGVYVPSRNGFIGPDEAFRWPEWPEADPRPPKHWGTTAIDVKAGGLYVVAPGSIHKTGREYTSTVPMKEVTPSFLASLPVFDAAKYEAMSAATKAEKRRRRMERLRLSTVPKAAKKVIGQHLAGEIDGDTVLHLADGGTSTIEQVASALQSGGDTVSVFCPEHGNNETPAATVGRGFDGRPFLRCFGSCCTTFKVPHDNGIGLGFFGFDTKPKAEPESEEVEAEQDAEPWVVPPLPSPAEAPVVLVATPMCSRKSTRVAELLGQGHIKTAVLVNPTIALAADGARKFAAKLYSDVDGQIVLDEVWVVCAPSLRRVSVYDKAGNYIRPDLVVIEEIEQTMSILHAASIMRHKGRDIRGCTYHRLAHLCRSCLKGGGQVIALDANGSERAVRDLQRLTGQHTIRSIEAPVAARTVWSDQVERRFQHPADLLADLLMRADDPAARGIAYINSQIDLLAVERLLKAKGRTVLAIHGNATPEAKATLADVNTHWATDKADWVLYNDAAGSGVSCDVEGRHAYNFTRVWPGYTWAASIQGIGRARRPASLASWVEPKVIGWSVDHREIRSALLRQVEDTMAMTYDEDEQGRPEPAPLDRSYFDSLADHYWITRLRGRNVAGGYYDVREQVYGIDVQDAPELADDARKSVMDAFNAAREAVKDKATDDVFDSIRIPDLDAEAFEKRADLTPEERAQLDKHATLDRWGRDDRDLVEDTVVSRGRRWKKARSLVTGAAILLGLRGRVREAEKRRMEVEAKDGKRYVYKAQAGHDEARADEIAEILRLANSDLDRIAKTFRLPDPSEPWEPPEDCIILRDGGFTTFGLVPSPAAKCPQDAPSITTEPGHPVDTFWSDETLVVQGFADAVRARAKGRDYGLLGIPTIPKDFDQAPSRWLGKVLAEWGIKTKPSRHPAGVIDPMTGNVTPEADDKMLNHRAIEAGWKREKRAAKKAGREPDESLRPPAKSSYRTIDWDTFAETATLVRRLNKKVQGHRVVSVEELAVLRLDPDEPELPDDLFDAVVPQPAPEDEVPPEAWACIRNESRPLAERVRVVLASPSPPHVQRVLLAALGVDTDGLRLDAAPVVGGDPQRSPPCPTTPNPSPSPPPSI